MRHHSRLSCAIAPYTTYDASLGARKDAWNVELFGQNMSDTRAQFCVNDGFTSVHLVTPNRPRTIGVRIGYRF
jgi:iron complex outermembrane receptor protein